MIFIIGIEDCDNYLINYLPIIDIIHVSMVNNALAKLVRKSIIYLEFNQLNNVPKKDILEYCYKKGLINVLKNYYNFGKNISTYFGIVYASENGHIGVLDWY